MLQRLLAEYLRRGARNVAMEVSSHGLRPGTRGGHQVRRRGVHQPHARPPRLPRHDGGVRAKPSSLLFSARGLKHADRERRRRLRRAARAAPRRKRPGRDHAHGYRSSARACRAATSCSPRRACASASKANGGAGEVRARVLGAFNVSNLLAVLGALVAAGHSVRRGVTRRSRRCEPVPGRLERVGGGATPLVVIDYAHTPDARWRRRSRRCVPTVAAGHRPHLRLRLRRRSRSGQAPDHGRGSPRASPTT